VSYLRSEHERAAFRRVYYPGTDVYMNKLGLRDKALLESAERMITRRRARQSFPRSATFRTYDGFRAIHRHLFRDLYPWAGKERSYTTGRGAIPFAVPEHIGPWMQQQFNKLAAERYLVGLGLEAFAEAAAVYVNEINAAHPFIDGNGRTQRFWLRMLADNAGFDLTLTGRDSTAWNEASRLGFAKSDHAPMAVLLKKRLNPR
jgi:fido (protein-threonine AMPylation protein)